MATTSKARARNLLAWAGLALAAGLAYAFFTAATGLAVPCPFHAVTGLWCPGCGVTRMCLALLRLDPAAAWAANPGLLLAAPLLAFLFARMAWRYVKAGHGRPARWETVLLWCVVAYLLAYGVARNLPAFSFLAPA